MFYLTNVGHTPGTRNWIYLTMNKVSDSFILYDNTIENPLEQNQPATYSVSVNQCCWLKFACRAGYRDSDSVLSCFAFRARLTDKNVEIIAEIASPVLPVQFSRNWGWAAETGGDRVWTCNGISSIIASRLTHWGDERWSHIWLWMNDEDHGYLVVTYLISHSKENLKLNLVSKFWISLSINHNRVISEIWQCCDKDWQSCGL